MVERLFRLKENRTTSRTEVLAGVTTFMTMAYILFVQPAVLSQDFSGNPTGLSSGGGPLRDLCGGVLGVPPDGPARQLSDRTGPGHGGELLLRYGRHGAYRGRVFRVMEGCTGITLMAGLLFLLFCLLGFQSAIIDAISPSLKNGIAVGIGLFICFIGLKGAGLVIESPGTAIRLNPDVTDPGVLIFLAGLLATGVLSSLNVRGAILWGILINAVIALLAGQLEWQGVVGFPKEVALFSFDFGWLARPETYLTVLPYVVVFLFMDVFDTAGTLIGVGEQAGFIKGIACPGPSRHSCRTRWQRWRVRAWARARLPPTSKARPGWPAGAGQGCLPSRPDCSSCLRCFSLPWLGAWGDTRRLRLPPCSSSGA